MSSTFESNWIFDDLLSIPSFMEDVVHFHQMLPEGHVAPATPPNTPPKAKKNKTVSWADEIRSAGKKSVRFACHDEIITPRRCEKRVGFVGGDEVILPRLLKVKIEAVDKKKVVKKVRFATNDVVINDGGCGDDGNENDMLMRSMMAMSISDDAGSTDDDFNADVEFGAYLEGGRLVQPALEREKFVDRKGRLRWF